MSFRALLHCSVGQGPEVGEYFWRGRGIHHSLGEEDADHSLLWIVISGCAENAGPAVAAGGVEDLAAVNVYRRSEAPTGKDAQADLGALALLRGEMIRGH